MAIEGIGATLSIGGSTIGEVVDITIPDDESKEYEVTTLSDTREQFKLSAMSVGQELNFTYRLNPEVPPVTKTVHGAANPEIIITLSKQTGASASGATYTFDAYIRMVTGGDLTTAGTEGVIQTATCRLATEIVFVAEA